MRAYHKHGTFQTPIVEDVAALIKNWEECKQNHLKKLAALIRKIVNLVKECEGKAVLKYNAKEDKLMICKVEVKNMLPEDLYLKWENEQNCEAENGAQDDNTQGRENKSTVRNIRK